MTFFLLFLTTPLWAQVSFLSSSPHFFLLNQAAPGDFISARSSSLGFMITPENQKWLHLGFDSLSWSANRWIHTGLAPSISFSFNLESEDKPFSQVFISQNLGIGWSRPGPLHSDESLSKVSLLTKCYLSYVFSLTKNWAAGFNLSYNAYRFFGPIPARESRSQFFFTSGLSFFYHFQKEQAL